MSEFVITTSIGGVSRSQIWNSRTPLPLGHPLRWIIEKTGNGVRARELGGPLNEVRENTCFEIPNDELDRGIAIRIPSTQSMAISIRKARAIPALSKSPQTQSTTEKGELRIYTCLGHWIQKAEPLNAEKFRSPHFVLSRDHGEFRLTILNSSEVLASGVSGIPEKLTKEATLTLSSEQLSNLSLSAGATAWHFGFIQEFAGSASDFNRATLVDEDQEAFRKFLRYTATALGVFLLTAILWPKPKPSEEIIPTQVAKIILTAPKKHEKGHKESGGSSQATAQNTVQKAAVVQAFRAKALKNSISGLLKGGMTRLLAQSDFAAGTTGTAGRQLFDIKNTGLLASAGPTGINTANAVTVASLGGAGGGAAGGIGYGKGHRAGIQGQGTSQVSLDIGNSQVEEGLTKDEVGEVIHRHLSEVRYCYESAILRTPGIEGRLIVNFTIGGSGAVKSSEIKSSNLPDPRLDDCILRRLVTWKFPQTKGGIDVAVTYPFIFKMLGGR